MTNKKEKFDYLICAEDSNIVIKKYLNEKVWNEKYQEYFTKTQVICKSDNVGYLADILEFMYDHANVGRVYSSSSMDNGVEAGFFHVGDAKALWNEAVEIYRGV